LTQSALLIKVLSDDTHIRRNAAMHPETLSPAEELSFLRSLAEAGRDAPLTAGPYLVAGGGWFGVASLLIGLQDLGFFALQGNVMAALMLGAVAGFAVTLYLLIRRDSRHVPNTTNRVVGAAWSAVGLGIFAFFVAVAIVAARSGNGFIMNSIALAVLTLYGSAWQLTGAVTGQRWMTRVTVLTFASLLIVAAAVGTPYAWVAYAVALVVSAVVPGLYLMRLARA
jgi:hypothetical protein